MVVIAIDPSITNTGWAVLDDGKLILTGRQPCRDHTQIRELVNTLYSAVGIDLDLVVIEDGHIGVNAKTGMQLAELRGALTYAWRDHGISVQRVQPSAWRKTVLHPKGRLKRKELKALSKAFVLARFGVSVSDDESDAVCLAVHAANDNAQ